MNTFTDVFERLMKISDVSSPYIPEYGSNIEKQKNQMEAEISQIEKSIEDWTATAHYCLAVAYRNFCSWYVRGDLRKIFLTKVVDHLANAITLDKNHIDSKVELARILIEEKVIRDLPKALNLTAELRLTSAFPSWMDSIEAKAKRWNDEIRIPNDSKFKNLDPTPATLREERTKLRKILSELQKSGNIAQKVVARRLYNLGLYVAYLYGSHDCNSGVAGFQYDEAVKVAKKVSNKFNFNYLGKIENASFLSVQDYKKIERALGENSNSITASRVRGLI